MLINFIFLSMFLAVSLFLGYQVYSGLERLGYGLSDMWAMIAFCFMFWFYGRECMWSIYKNIIKLKEARRERALVLDRRKGMALLKNRTWKQSKGGDS